MNRFVLRAATFLATAFGVLALLIPTASAEAATDSVAAPRQLQNVINCQNWSVAIAEGHAAGTWCSNYTVVSGTVTDDRADGHCPYVRSTWSNGSVSDGPWVGPKGASKSFTLYAPSGTWSTQVSIRWVYC
jgi:hypothetical protein